MQGTNTLHPDGAEEKNTEEIRDVVALADLYASLECAAEALHIKSQKNVKGKRRSA